MSIDEAPCFDAIPADVFKSSGSSLIKKLADRFQFRWKKETLQQEFKNTAIVHLCRKKGKKRSCDKHRGILLLSNAGKK